jgi:hypothetical protein
MSSTEIHRIEWTRSCPVDKIGDAITEPSTPPEAVDEVIEGARSGERLTHAEIKGKIDEIKRMQATAAGIKRQRGSSKKRTKAEGLTAPEQETIKEWNQMLLKIVSYVLERDGRVDPNDNEWMLLVGRAKLMFKALMSGLVPIARERWRAQRQRLAHRGFANKLGARVQELRCRGECGSASVRTPRHSTPPHRDAVKGHDDGCGRAGPRTHR